MSKILRFSVQEFHSSKKYKHWAGVFEEYSKLTDRFIRVHYDQYGYSDAPYWNIERTNVGILSAACWGNGWVALEEFATEKIKDDETDGAGRCDLWVSSQGGAKNYAIEAKKGHSSLDSNKLIQNLRNLLGNSDSGKGSAFFDAKKLKEGEVGDDRMALAFMHLYLKKSKQKNVEDIVKRVIAEIKLFSETSEVDFIYIYLKDNSVTSTTGSMIPGVVIAGKVIEDTI